MNGKQRIDPELAPDLEIKVEQKSRRLQLIPMLPSLITLANLFCGFLAIAYAADAVLLASKGDMAATVDRIADAGWVIFLAMVFDALDGRVARITGQVTPFGGVLDSLADMVTFGVAPAFMTKALAEQVLGLTNHRVVLGFCVFFVLCAALRLARYSAETSPDEHGHQSFQGLPSPGAAGVVAGLALFYGRYFEWEGARYVIAALPFVVPILGVLMISRIQYPHVMNRYLGGPKPMKNMVFLAFIVVVPLVLRGVEAAIAGLLVLFALIGPARFLLRLATGRAGRAELDIFD